MNLKPYQTYLEETVIPLRLACRTSSGWPFILSLWYLFEDDGLYCATQSSAKIVALLQNDARCAFEIASDQPPYCGIRGRAEAEIVHHRGGEILTRLLTRYLGGPTSSLARHLLENQASEVAIHLRPVSVYVWNFTDRMRDAITGSIEKPCP